IGSITVTYPNPDLNLLPVRSPADLLALLPYLIGYVPVDSLVAVALNQGQIIFTGRIDLPANPDTAGGGNDTGRYEVQTRETPAAAHAVYAGRVALPNRAAYAARLAPIDGPERDAMDRATTRPPAVWRSYSTAPPPTPTRCTRWAGGDPRRPPALPAGRPTVR